jgi:hypothetical protein
MLTSTFRYDTIEVENWLNLNVELFYILLLTFETFTPSPSMGIYKEVSQCEKSWLIVFEFRYLDNDHSNELYIVIIYAWVLSTNTSLIKEVVLCFYAEVLPLHQ